MIKLKSLISELYPKTAKFGLGTVDSNGGVHFKEFSKDYVMTMTHGAAGLPMSRNRFRYNNGKVEWTDRPTGEIKSITSNYLTRKGYNVECNKGYWDNEDYDIPDRRYDDIDESVTTTKFVPPKEKENREGRFWWLSPEGKFYGVTHESHINWARNYLINSLHMSPEQIDRWKDVQNNSQGEINTDEIKSSPYYILLAMGWLRVGLYDDWLGDGDKETIIDYDYKRGENPPPFILKKIKDLAIEKGIKWMKRDRERRVIKIDENSSYEN